jgi:hypothetical protein
MEYKEFYNVLLFIPTGLIIIGFLTGIIKKGLGRTQKLLVGALALALLVELVSLILAHFAIRNYFLFHIYTPIEYALFALLLSIHLNSFEKRLVNLSILLILTFAIVNLIFFQNAYQLNTNVITTSSIALVVISVILFFRILSKMIYRRIEKSSFFWINIGILIYFSSSLVLFAFGDWLAVVSLEYSISIWVIHVFFNVIQYICFNIALWMDPE